jgi:hypothetical protein
MAGNNASPPFATPDGKPSGNAGGNASGAHDFVKDPKSGAAPSGGRDFTKESRAQSEAKPEVVPNPQEIPSGMGGKVLQADPTPVSAKVSGTAQHTGPSSPKPFKGMK